MRRFRGSIKPWKLVHNEDEVSTIMSGSALIAEVWGIPEFKVSVEEKEANGEVLANALRLLSTLIKFTGSPTQKVKTRKNGEDISITISKEVFDNARQLVDEILGTD